MLVTLLLCVAGCSGPAATDLPSPTPKEVVIGGVRPTITRQDLIAARAGVPGGLMEPCWLPDGFALVHVAYIAPERTTDLYYTGNENYLHIWQTHRDPSELGSDDPVVQGDPLPLAGDIEWRARSLAPLGRSGVAEYSARLPDGRTVSIDSNLGRADVERILESVCVRA
ncbi:MAG: hypothetical protein IT341_03890 [Chloroflexi bacterium]|nr:hypothetical protein [Chloroflexota bacterium]